MSMVASTGSPEPAALQDVLQRAHRLVVAHVLVDGQRDAGRGTRFDAVAGFAHRQGERLLSQDAAEAAACRPRQPADQGGLRVGRHGDVEDFDVRVGEQVLDGVVNGRDAVPCGDRLRGLSRSREAMATGLKPACAVGDEVAVAP